MKNLFEQSRSHWVRYDRYELKAAADGKRYITPGKNAKPDIYNPCLLYTSPSPRD